MKLFSLICGLMLFGAAATTAQDLPEKELLIVDLFARNRTVPAPYAEAVRVEVANALLDRGRQNIVDAEVSGILPPINPLTAVTTPPTAVADVSDFLQFRIPQATEAGARYLVTGAVIDYKFSHVALPSTDSKKPPIQGYKSDFRVLISAYDLKLGKRLTDTFYDLSAAAPIAEDADRMALKQLRTRMEFYINNNFKFETRILELCPPDKKGRFRELFIHAGTAIGVKNGDLFMVYEEVAIGGVITHQKIGRLRVSNVDNPNVARCKVAKGDEQIADAFLANRKLVCVSDGEAFF